MIDGCGREIDHLRLSLTDRCNLACRYCAPEDAKDTTDAFTVINADFAFEVVRWLSDRHGIRHLRLTGGEPLLFPPLLPLVRRLSGLRHLHEITLTTNAQALAKRATALRDAGLSRINISLDTLRQDRFAHLTRGGKVKHTMEGIEAGVAAGLSPVKINVVAQRGLNDDELADMAEWGLSRGCVVRFLEVMPIGPLAHVVDQHLVPALEILERLSARFALTPIPSSVGQPATDYAATRGPLRGVIGIIGATTKPFCSRCRRLRVTSHGSLVACVHEADRFDVSTCWDGRVLDHVRADAILQRAVGGKPAVGSRSQSLTMLSLGG